MGETKCTLTGHNGKIKIQRQGMKRNWKAGYKKRQKRRTEEKGTETTGEHKQLKYTRLPVNFSSRVDIASHESGAIASDGHP